jgi:hypothetical protein
MKEYRPRSINPILWPWGSAALTCETHTLSDKVGTKFADRQRSLGRYSLVPNSGHALKTKVNLYLYSSLRESFIYSALLSEVKELGGGNEISRT